MAQTRKKKPPSGPKKVEKVATGILVPGTGRVYAHITGRSEQAGNVYARWELWRRHTCIARALNPRMHYHDPEAESWDDCVRQVIARVEDAFRREYVPDGSGEAADTEETGAFLQALTSLSPEETQMLRRHTWADSTWSKYYAALHRLCGDLDELQEYTPETLRQMREKMIHRALDNRLSKGRVKVTENVDKMLASLTYSIDALKEIVNNREGKALLPDVPLYDVISPGVRYAFEQIKWIDFRVTVCLVSLLFAGIGSGACMGIAAMLLLGLRTSECVAVLIGECELIDGCMVRYLVQHQGVDRTAILKTLNAYRIVLGGQLLYDLVTARIEYLRGLGFSDEEIRLMPLVGRDDDPTRPLAPEQLSMVARQLLHRAGYRESDMVLASKLMSIDPDFEVDGSPMVSVSAYIFRRHFATMVANCCDLMPGSGIEDYLLGHKRRKALPVDMTNQDIQLDLAHKLERLVYSPTHTAHPLYRPAVLGEEYAVHDMGTHVAYAYVAGAEVEVEVTVETREPNGKIWLETDAKCGKRTFCRQPGKVDVVDERASRPIVLMPPMPEDLARILEEFDASCKGEEEG